MLGWGRGDGEIAAVMTVYKIAAGDSAAYVAYLASQGPERRCGDYYLGHEGRPAEGPRQCLG
jgi:hypothetical protein